MYLHKSAQPIPSDHFSHVGIQEENEDQDDNEVVIKCDDTYDSSLEESNTGMSLTCYYHNAANILFEQFSRIEDKRGFGDLTALRCKIDDKYCKTSAMMIAHIIHAHKINLSYCTRNECR